MKKKNWYRRKAYTSKPVKLNEFLEDWLRTKARNPIVLHGKRLFENWDMVLGSDLAQDAFPVGIHNRTLLIATEDSMLLQDIRMNSAEILERVNAFMMACGDDLHFEKIEFSLVQGRTILTQSGTPSFRTEPYIPPAPKHLPPKEFPDNPALASCYKAYCECVEKEKQDKKNH